MTTALLSVLAVLAAGTAADCTANNCLRALRAPQRLEAAQAFCSTFTTVPVTATAAIPSFAVEACKDNQNGPLTARVSSACSCIATSTSTNTTPTPTASPTEPCAVVSSSWASQSAAGVGKLLLLISPDLQVPLLTETYSDADRSGGTCVRLSKLGSVAQG